MLVLQYDSMSAGASNAAHSMYVTDIHFLLIIQLHFLLAIDFLPFRIFFGGVSVAMWPGCVIQW